MRYEYKILVGNLKELDSLEASIQGPFERKPANI
jgi:hypothetical protein